MAIVENNYPLYFDAANEEGLGIAGLNFDGPCHYFPENAEKNNVTPFELIPYLLSQYTTVAEVKDALKDGKYKLFRKTTTFSTSLVNG